MKEGNGNGDEGVVAENGEDEEDPEEFLIISDNVTYLRPLVMVMALLHTFVSFAVMVAYYTLKVRLSHIILP